MSSWFMEDEMTKRIVVSLLIGFMVYPIAGFIAWDFTPSDWEPEGRFSMAVIGFWAFFIAFVSPLWD